MNTTAENTAAVDADTGAELLVIPITGEAIDVKAAAANELVQAVDRLVGYISDLGAVRRAVEVELIRRLDATNARREMVGDDVELETNAPATDVYDLATLEEQLKRLVDEDVIDAVVLERIIVQPPPKPQDRKLDKRELNKLKGHDDPRVGRALGVARERRPNNRTLKINRKAAR